MNTDSACGDGNDDGWNARFTRFVLEWRGGRRKGGGGAGPHFCLTRRRDKELGREVKEGVRQKANAKEDEIQRG